MIGRPTMILKTNLMPHQKAAADKLTPIRVGALFMEMGTGKTRTAIEIVHRRLGKIDKVVWFCPVSLKINTLNEVLKHTNLEEKHICLTDSNTKISGNIFFYIIGIESMSMSISTVLTANELITKNTFVFVDESSYIKGFNSVRTKRITDISQKARYRMILNGTPISQGVVDLYAQMKFLHWKILGYRSFYAFANNHLEYSEKYKGMIVESLNVDNLIRKMSPYIFQVTKNECLELPEKIYIKRYFSMTQEQHDCYLMVKEHFLIKLDDRTDSTIIFRLFSALQQIVCGFLKKTYIGKNYKFDHYRIDTLQEVISEIDQDKKIVIWCRYKNDIYNIKKALSKTYSDDDIALYHGRLSEKNRNKELEKFKTTSKFLIITQSCGGYGLTLNEANFVIYYNNTFKYSDRIQSEDRFHRIGQKNNVTYIDIICEDSIDTRIMAAIDAKEDMATTLKRNITKTSGASTFIKDL